MPPINWHVFEALPGSTEANFEMLCRALIRRHYGRYGSFAALANQPGVEFHLKLHTPCSLGESGRWYGWQCRWYDIPGGRALGTTRRNKIKKAIKTTERTLPGLTDWVLWTRHRLTRGDQNWFYGLSTHMRLYLWSDAEVEEHLSGEAAIFRSTYFGELVLTPDNLRMLHESAVAPIRRRWQPEVHQTIDAERELRQMLGQSDTWRHLRGFASRLSADAAGVDRDRANISTQFLEAVDEVAQLAREFGTIVADVDAGLNLGDLDLLRQRFTLAPPVPRQELRALPHQLRAAREPAALSVTNSLADARYAEELISQVSDYMSTRLTAVVADAGCGKTELAAQLTAEVGDRPAGILLHGRDLHAGQCLDDLARHVIVQANPVQSMEALIAAVDAAGQRARRRLPIVIDGLNESEDPRDWKGQLASLDETLVGYPYVIVICTLRSAFVEEALPPTVKRLEIPNFGHDTIDAIQRYFAYYRIDRADAELPMGLLTHPLTLRLFCEVTNPKRERVVGIEATPESLTGLFDRYLEQAAERIAEIAPRNHRYYEQDIRTALDEIGEALWEENTRTLDLVSIRRTLNDDARPWNESIIRALEFDGVLVRMPGNAPGATRVAAVYDALAGHLVGDAILARHGRSGFDEWLKNPATAAMLMGPLQGQHPLAADIFRALVGLAPRRLHRQHLWPLLNEPMRTAALRGAADLEGAYLDAETVAELRTFVAQPSQSATSARDLRYSGGQNRLDLRYAASRNTLDGSIFYRLWQTRGAPTHPLNAEFLDLVLRPMNVADRDLRWTEWIRRNEREVLADLKRLEMGWTAKKERTRADGLRARWTMWTLTSTVRELRDEATRTLYWFGRGDPRALFELALDALDINDQYVAERLLAASYGVAMANQIPDSKFGDALRDFLIGLRQTLTGRSATHPTSHWLSRMYAQGIATFAGMYYPATLPEDLAGNAHLLFAPGPTVDLITKEDARATEVDMTLHMDFENYTLGSLFRDRDNYNMNHCGHKAAVAYVRGTVWSLGWRESTLGAIDKELARQSSRHDRAPTERYGKKYGWIGFYSYAGALVDGGLLPHNERLSELGVDPSFPEPPSQAAINLPIWARPTPTDDRRWIRQGIIAVPDEVLYRSDIDSHTGPWIGVHGHLNTKDQATGRHVFGILNALLVSGAGAGRLERELKTRHYPGNWWLPQVPDGHYTFAGEVPWNPEFARGPQGDPTDLYKELVRLSSGSPIKVEILAHCYAWESYHSALNQAGGALVPSRSFSAKFDLRSIPQSFNQTLADGAVAAVSVRAPAGFDGHLLYLREDLVRRYAAGRRLIWFIWGERQLNPYPHPSLEWLISAQQSGADVWRYVRRGEELSPTFSTKRRRRTGRSKQKLESRQ
jgi:hypothetical protein